MAVWPSSDQFANENIFETKEKKDGHRSVNGVEWPLSVGTGGDTLAPDWGPTRGGAALKQDNDTDLGKKPRRHTTEPRATESKKAGEETSALKTIDPPEGPSYAQAPKPQAPALGPVDPDAVLRRQSRTIDAAYAGCWRAATAVDFGHGAKRLADSAPPKAYQGPTRYCGGKRDGAGENAATATPSQLEKGSGGVSELHAAFASTLGEAAMVRTLLPQTTIEVHNLDKVTDEAEIRNALVTFTSCPDYAVALRPAFRDTQMAIVRLPTEDAKKITQEGRLKVRWINCRVREQTQVVRCFRCHGFGHYSANCGDPVDGSTSCMRCGQDGHLSKACTRDPRCSVCAAAGGPASAGHVLGSRQPERGLFEGTKPSEEMINFLQLNVNKCWVTQDLMLQTAREKRADVLLLSEVNPAGAPEDWLQDNTASGAIAITNSNVPLRPGGRGTGFVRAWIGSARVYNCYFSPNTSIDIFVGQLDVLEYSIRGHGSGWALVAGDFNAKSAGWGSAQTDERGLLLRFYGNVNVEHTGSSSIIDVTLASAGLAAAISSWRVLESEESLSDHGYISFLWMGQAAKPLQPGTQKG
ncbi:uncharacterized protein LOC107218032 [Neodiprion lecontei]|uniref:Uncharacterized protein LOC107218032 n=1 Tax=Neodiprion lecontei TaxID=441921 RepID=A0A6J0BAK2_NEOLC|nr:uncharacterized protein LOC107218032 [Neodiprion lecontei]